MAQDQSNHNDLPTIGNASSEPKRHLDDQIRMFEVGMVEAIGQSFNDTLEAGKTSFKGVVLGDRESLEKIAESSEGINAAISNPETFGKLVAALSVSAGELEKRMKNGDYHGAGLMAGAVMAGIIEPGGLEKKALKNGIELGSEALKDTAKLANKADILPPSYKDFLPMSARDLAHLMFMPQNASPVRMERFKELLESGVQANNIHGMRMQMSGVPYAWATFGGGAAIAANTVVNGIEADKESVKNEARAKLSPSELKALVFEESVNVASKEKEALKQFPDLKTHFEQYRTAVSDAIANHPNDESGHTSQEAVSQIWKSKLDIKESIKHENLQHPEQRSSIDILTLEQKVAAIAQHIETLPESQRRVAQESLAQSANKSGMQITEETPSLSPSQQHERA